MTQLEQPRTEAKFITRRALAVRWGTSVATIRRKEVAGKLTPRREINATVRYALEQVLAVEEGRGA